MALPGRRGALAAILVLAVAVPLTLVAGAGSPVGSHMAVVKGRSMEPILHTGDIVFLKHPPPDGIRVGDVVVYTRGGGFVIHRVVKVYRHGSATCYVVWGDNRKTNPIPDPGDPLSCGTTTLRVGGYAYTASGIPYSRIVGVVVSVHGSLLKIPYLGGFSLLFR
ncbi:MAG: signal peptidase I [Desulfurococcales archaeon]|nr:signal peptidase I [Desulfurococcales archaeon]